MAEIKIELSLALTFILFSIIENSNFMKKTFLTELSNKMISVCVIQKLASYLKLSITQLYIETNKKQLLNDVSL